MSRENGVEVGGQYEAEVPYEVESPNELLIENRNLLKITNEADFYNGEVSNLDFVGNIGDGALRLTEGTTEGTFVSAVYIGSAERPLDFEYLVASWNADLPEGTWIEVLARAYIQDEPGTEGAGDAWTDWLSWGAWSPWIRRTSANDSDALAYMDTDIFSVRGSRGATKLQLKAILTRESTSAEAPVLRQLTATWKNTNSGREVPPEYAESEMTPLPEEIRLSSPAYSQMIRDPAIGNSICSPTTISVMLNDRDPSLDLLPEEVALHVLDFNYGFGNWSFTVAGAGAYGFEAYVQYADFDIVMQELAKGNSVGMSVSYSTDPNASNYLENAPLPTPGHLITLTGYYKEGGETYFYSSDSASPTEYEASGEHRFYKMSQLDVAWRSRVIYVIPSQIPESNAGRYAPGRIGASIETANENEYRLTVGGSPIPLTPGFASAKTDILGRGTLAYTVEGIQTTMPDRVTPVTANKTFFYNLSIRENGNIYFNAEEVFRSLGIAPGDERAVTFYIIYNDGKMYTATATMARDAGFIALPMMDENGQDVTPGDFDLSVRPAGETTVIEFTGSQIPTYQRSADGQAGKWVGAGIGVPAEADLSRAQYSLGAVPDRGTFVPLTETDQMNNAEYALFYLDAGAQEPELYLSIDWNGDGKTVDYQFSVVQLILEDPIAVSDNNAVLLNQPTDFEKGAVSPGTVVTPKGVTLEGADTGYYLSPVYSTGEFEWLIASWNAVTPGASSVEVEVRANTLRQPGWSGWHSFGVWGTGVEGGSKPSTSDYVNMDTDIFILRGSADVASANAFQLRVTLRADGEHTPALYALSASYKKELAGKETSAAWLGSAVDPLPDKAVLEVPAYSLWSYNMGNVSYRFENLMLMALNGQGANLLFEEVFLAGYDFAGGYGNWAYTPAKAGAFGYSGYAQYNADPEMIRQALANGTIPIVFASTTGLNASNRNAARQVLIYGYETLEDGSILYHCICPCADLDELAEGDVFYTCTEDALKEAIVGYSSGSARSLVYFVGPKSMDASVTRQGATLRKRSDSTYDLQVNGRTVALPENFISGATNVFGCGKIVYYMTGEAPDAEKLAEQKLYYDITVNSSGQLVIPERLQVRIAGGETAQVFVVTNGGVTYQATLRKNSGSIVLPGDVTSMGETDEGKSSVEVEALSEGAGIYTARVEAGDVQKALEALMKEQKSADEEVVLTVNVTVPAGASLVNTILPAASIDLIAKNRQASLKVETVLGALLLDNAALAELGRIHQGRPVTLSVAAHAVSGLGAMVQDVAAGDVAVRAAVTVEGQETDAFAGMVQVFLPYPLDEEQDAREFAVAWLDEDGRLHKLEQVWNDPERRGYWGVASTGQLLLITRNVAKYMTDYDDITRDDWFYDAVRYVTETVAMTGTASNTFSPGLTMSRGMLVTVLYRQAGEPETAQSAAYADVADGQWYSPAVAWASGQGIVQGYGPDRFGAADHITREQLVTILYRQAVLAGETVALSDGLDAFPDGADVSSWAREAMLWAVAESIVTGRTDGALDPAGLTTRAEGAAILLRYASGVKQ